MLAYMSSRMSSAFICMLSLHRACLTLQLSAPACLLPTGQHLILLTSLPLLLPGSMSADSLVAPRFPLDVLEDGILTKVLLAAARSKNQEQREQQQWLYGIFPLVCRRFLELVRSSCNSILVPSTAEHRPSPLFARWLTHHGSRLQELTIPARLLVAVAAQQPPMLPSLSNLCSLQLTPGCSEVVVEPPEQVLSALKPLSKLRELQLPEVCSGHPWTTATLSKLSTCFTSLTTITIGRPAELGSLAPLSQLKQLQNLKLNDFVTVSELRHATALPISSLLLEEGKDDEAELMEWLKIGAAVKLQSLFAYRVSCSEALVKSLAQLPQLRKLSIAAPSVSRHVAAQMQTSVLQPLSSSSSLTSLALGGSWEGPIIIGHLPSTLVDLVFIEGGLSNWGPSGDLARRLGRLIALWLGCVTAEDVPKLALLTGLRSLAVTGWEDGGTFNTASWQGFSTLSCLTHLKLDACGLREGTPDILPLVTSLSCLRFLGLWDQVVVGVSLPTV